MWKREREIGKRRKRHWREGRGEIMGETSVRSSGQEERRKCLEKRERERRQKKENRRGKNKWCKCWKLKRGKKY